MEHEDPYHQQAPWPLRSKVKVAMSWCVWQVLENKSRRPIKSHKNKIDGKVAHPTGNNAHQFQGHKVKGQGHQAD